MRGASSPILLDAWAARSCPVKTQNAFDPQLSESVGDPRDDELFAGAQAHVTAVCDAWLLYLTPSTCDLTRPVRLVVEPQLTELSMPGHPSSSVQNCHRVPRGIALVLPMPSRWQEPAPMGAQDTYQLSSRTI
ncbi:hypothetical protein JCM18918_2513 [Cutibacterium acnes JCM 18918]|nr:hypothetical protein JCM18918_2513 [Cutibacterium acnes JCM 18918]